jgi:hypothetical protein
MLDGPECFNPILSRSKRLGNKSAYADSGVDEFDETDEDPLAIAIETK